VEEVNHVHQCLPFSKLRQRRFRDMGDVRVTIARKRSRIGGERSLVETLLGPSIEKCYSACWTNMKAVVECSFSLDRGSTRGLSTFGYRVLRMKQTGSFMSDVELRGLDWSWRGRKRAIVDAPPGC
jgi:hypothetical protein